MAGKNISEEWFFEWDYGMGDPKGLPDIIRKQLIYGVAFDLIEDSCKTDQEIIGELQKTYPGDYEYSEEWGLKRYKWERDCLTIFVKRRYHEGGISVPEVSFCYGLTDMQTRMYGLYTGYINRYPD
ncbi:hypothetical protein [Dyadobacter luticola]|uniref:Uncharacterized protein n=1 Tax=Dyadobacter luticola TaxID=1979387 RepID=A0A5R9KV77_9BACT|nr:hypothetical protein [Dyadobacter luticola]TLV00144.1 hypothetical protein FEN17_11590 [Dyadobacter luticola]